MTLDQIAKEMGRAGFVIVPNFMDPICVENLAATIDELDDQNLLTNAQVGRADSRQLLPEIRGDKIKWLDDDPADSSQRLLRERLELLREKLNEKLLLGLFTFEGHFALYTPGKGYQRH